MRSPQDEQSQGRGGNKAMKITGILFFAISAVPANAKQPNARRNKNRTLENNLFKSFKPSSDAEESDPKQSQKC